MRPPEKSACRQSPDSAFAQSTADNLLGEYSTLLQQLGGCEIFSPSDLSAAFLAGRVTDLSSLQKFLETYLSQILLPIELPAIAAACGRVLRGELRELIDLDLQLAGDARLAPFASASRAMGSLQLRRLRPLRDERTVQRYLGAVKTGQAHGWHTLVYGLTLAVYSFPLRQGLLHYARETISGLARAAVGSGNLAEAGFQEMLEAILTHLPEAVELTVPACESAWQGKVEDKTQRME